MDENKIWEFRAFIYRHFAETARAPFVEQAAAQFDLKMEQAVSAYQDLQQRHAILLQPGTHQIQMAWPFSGVETHFKVRVSDKAYFANCAWDSLGIPAALHVDAEIEAKCAQSGEPIRISVTHEEIQGPEALVHFLVPFQDWYNDLPFT